MHLIWNENKINKLSVDGINKHDKIQWSFTWQPFFKNIFRHRFNLPAPPHSHYKNNNWKSDEHQIRYNISIRMHMKQQQQNRNIHSRENEMKATGTKNATSTVGNFWRRLSTVFFFFTTKRLNIIDKKCSIRQQQFIQSNRANNVFHFWMLWPLSCTFDWKHIHHAIDFILTEQNFILSILSWTDWQAIYSSFFLSFCCSNEITRHNISNMSGLFNGFKQNKQLH